jgi:hypothetical protein
MWAVNGKTLEVGFPKPLGAHIIPPYAQMPDIKLQDLCLSCWISVLLWSHLSFLCPYTSLLEWEHLLCVFAYWKCTTLLVLQEFTAKELPLSLRGDFELDLLSNAGTVEMMVTLGDRLN